MDDARDETPEAILAHIRAAARGDDPDDVDPGDRLLNRLVERFPSDRLRVALRPRLAHLDEADGLVVLRLVEAQLDARLADDLARALIGQPDLAPERAWEALALLEGEGTLERFPELLERWDELNDAIDPELANEDLASQLEEDPLGSWVALEGLGAIEPGTREEIITSLADAPSGPGLVAFLRLLTFAHDDRTRRAACDAIFAYHRDDPDHRRAWAELAHDHFDPKVRDRARRHLAIGGHDDAGIDRAIAEALDSPLRARPDLVGALVTAVDGSGRGTVVLAGQDRGEWVVARFDCDVHRGIVGVVGQVGADPSFLAGSFDEVAARHPGEVIVEDAVDLGVALLAASWLVSGPETNPALRSWIERTVGPGFQPKPLTPAFDPDDLATEALAMLAEPSWAILDACPTWADRSAATFELAEALLLRPGDNPPDPRRDAGAYRFLFEHRLAGRLEHYRRLLLWMSPVWEAAGDPDLARSSLALATQLADPQNVVPGHPFAQALITTSLLAAQADLRRGVDPRRDQLRSG